MRGVVSWRSRSKLRSSTSAYSVSFPSRAGKRKSEKTQGEIAYRFGHISRDTGAILRAPGADLLASGISSLSHGHSCS